MMFSVIGADDSFAGISTDVNELTSDESFQAMLIVNGWERSTPERVTVAATCPPLSSTSSREMFTERANASRASSDSNCRRFRPAELIAGAFRLVFAAMLTRRSLAALRWRFIDPCSRKVTDGSANKRTLKRRVEISASQLRNFESSIVNRDRNINHRAMDGVLAAESPARTAQPQAALL